VLGRIGDKTDVAAMRELLSADLKPADRALVEQALASLGDARSRAALAEHFKADDTETRALAAETAGYCGAVEWIDPLTKLLDDRALDVRLRAAAALLQLGK
jgi:HEAT repeat protein